MYENELCVDFFISHYGFREGFGEHKPKEYENMVRCSCGKNFPQGVRQLGMEKFKKHLGEIEKLKKDALSEEVE